MKIIVIIILIFMLETVLFEFNSALYDLKKYRPKINIIIVNGIVLILATIAFIMSQNRYDLDNDGNVDFDDILILKQYVMEKEKSN